MDYQKHYNLLISTRLKFQKERIVIFNNRKNCSKDSKLKMQLFHSHHIKPKCLGGSNINENLILLTPIEHFISHRLLAKIYPSTNLVKAILRLSIDKYGNKINGRKYELICKEISKSMMGNRNPMWKSGVNNPFYGKTHSVKSRKKMSTNNRMNNIFPWKHHSVKISTTLLKWYLADIIYNIWIKNNKCGSCQLYTKCSNESEIFKQYGKIYRTIIPWFIVNGDPKANKDWLEFKDNFYISY